MHHGTLWNTCQSFSGSSHPFLNLFLCHPFYKPSFPPFRRKEPALLLGILDLHLNTQSYDMRYG